MGIHFVEIERFLLGLDALPSRCALAGHDSIAKESRVLMHPAFFRLETRYGAAESIGFRPWLRRE